MNTPEALNKVHEIIGKAEAQGAKAVSFVGANQAGEYIYRTASNTGKRVQSNMGAKNHAIIMPDADREDAINAMVCLLYTSPSPRDS